ncbi:MAG TPA: sigma-70 family RNA polymerase sigma factor [Chthoniobacteraceae bacterium]|jgi:RNA polymerase sigma-70 factor (ECF subfamily)
MLYSIENHSLDSNVQEATDETLMVAVSQGDQAALEVLYKRHGAHLKAIVLRVIHDEGLADDLVQEIFLEVWRLASRYSPEKGLALGWLITLARRRAIDRLRKLQAYGRAEDRLEAEVRQAPEMTRHDVDQDLAANDMREVLRKIILTLPPAQQQAVDLAFYKGMSQREIAAHTSIPLGTIKTRLELGVRKIGSALREVLGEAAAGPVMANF